MTSEQRARYAQKYTAKDAGAGGQVASPQRKSGFVQWLALVLWVVLLCWMAWLPSTARADVVRYGVHMGTYHFDRAHRYNEFNPGAYVIADGHTAGAYINSARRVSVYLGETIERGRWAVTLGAVSGYGKLAPLALVSVKLGAVRLGVFPPFGGKTGGVHVAAEF